MSGLSKRDVCPVRAPRRAASHSRAMLLLGLILWSLPHEVAAQISADSLAGTRATCVDFRSGGTFPVRAQHLRADGSVERSWDPGDSHLCLGSSPDVISRVVPDGAGGAVVVWVDMRSGDADIYAQRVTAAGTVAPPWPADGVPVCIARGFQDRIAVISDGAGGVLIAWQDYRNPPYAQIYAQRVTGDGQAAWAADGVPVSADSSDQSAPDLVADGGDALVVWQDLRAGDYDLRYARLQSDGTVAPAPGGAPLVTAPGDQRAPSFTASGVNAVTVVWQESLDGIVGLHTASFQLPLPTGLSPGQAGVIIASDVGSAPEVASCADGAGGVFVAWSSRAGSMSTTRLQHVAATGSAAFGDTGVAVCDEPHDRASPAVCADGAGGCLVAWEDFRNSGGDLYAQKMSAAGVRLWSQAGVPLAVAPGEQYGVSLRSDGAGGALATWGDDELPARAAFTRARPAVSGALPQLSSVETGPGRVQLVWRGQPGDPADYQVQRRADVEPWEYVQESRLGLDGSLVCEDRTVPPNSRVYYRLTMMSRNTMVALEETAVDVPAPMPLSLKFARMEERGRTVHVSFVLETHDRASIEALDLAGRRVLRRDLGAPGAGLHEYRFPSTALASGIYFVRLIQNNQIRTTRLTLVR